MSSLVGQKLLIRADANQQMGTGHVMRCLALAQAWQDAGGCATFVMAEKVPALETRLRSEGMEVARLTVQPGSLDDALQLADLGRNTGAAWFVVDGYHFDAKYQQIIKEQGQRLLFIEDNGHAQHYYADLVLNQNLHARESLYTNKEPSTRLLLGTRYSLLRREFLKWRGWCREIPKTARKVLVTLGGSDPNNVTLQAIQAVKKLTIEGVETVVVVGPANPHTSSWQKAVGPSHFTFHILPSENDMAGLMAWADVAVSAGGGTCWESAFMGLPNVILLLSENQRSIAEALDDLGTSVNLGWYAEIDRSHLTMALGRLMADQVLRYKMNEKGRSLVDGNGTKHVLNVMAKLILTDLLTNTNYLLVRRARFQDAKMLWLWANDARVRENSFHPESIPLREHIDWFQAKLTSPGTRMWILELNKTPVAQIRYDRVDKNTAEIDFSVLPNLRGMGLGTRALIGTSPIAFRELRVRRLKAIVFDANKASMRAFVKAGFKHIAQEKLCGKLCDIFVRERN